MSESSDRVETVETPTFSESPAAPEPAALARVEEPAEKAMVPAVPAGELVPAAQAPATSKRSRKKASTSARPSVEEAPAAVEVPAAQDVAQESQAEGDEPARDIRRVPRKRNRKPRAEAAAEQPEAQKAPERAPEAVGAAAAAPREESAAEAAPVADGVSSESEQRDEDERPRRDRREKAPRSRGDAPAPAEAPAAPANELSLDDLMASIPRRRRGRPSKKDLEARKALEAAKANPTPELVAQARAAAAAILGDAVKATSAQAPVEPVSAEPAEPEVSRPSQPEAAEETPAAEALSGEAPAATEGYGQRRRHHERRSEGQPAGENASRKNQGNQGGQNNQQSRRDRDQQNRRDRDGRNNDRDNRGDRQGNNRSNGQQNQGQGGSDRNDQQGRRDRSDRQNNNQQFNGKNNRRNNNRSQRDYPVEPKTNREELEELKVGDLRAKAMELGIDPAGLKKPELVDAVYSALVKQEGFFEFKGILDLTNEGFGFIRTRGYLGSEHDVYIGVNAVRANGLRRGDEVEGIAHAGRPNDKYPGVTRVTAINGKTPEELRGRPRFGDLTPVFPSEPLRMENGKDNILGRCIDLVAPIGKGQRGLIVSPPKAGKTTVLKKIAESIATNNPEVHLICLLVDERPEEVTDMQRSIKGEVVASTFDMPCDNHITVSELVIERAKRLVEQGEDVVILLDSITRLARAYNLAQPASGRILSGGVDSTALYPPKRFLGAARNIENGGSLTILASALVDTGSKMDEVIFEEFKGTGNMELKLDRDLADRRIFPAIDPIASGTRKEELLLDPSIAPFVWGIRRILSNMNSNERAMSSLIRSLKATANNEEFLIRSAKKAQMQEMNGEL